MLIRFYADRANWYLANRNDCMFYVISMVISTQSKCYHHSNECKYDFNTNYLDYYFNTWLLVLREKYFIIAHMYS